MADTQPPPLRLSHSTIAARDLDAMVDFYSEVLGFMVTNRGLAGPDGPELAFMSQDPSEHHQMVFISSDGTRDHDFVLADHLAFRTGSLDDLRAIGERLEAHGVEGVIPVSHGNAWSLYFTDPEGNGLECFVDSPYHVAQPYVGGLDLSGTDADVDAATRSDLDGKPEYQPIEDWRADFEAKLAGG